MREIHRLLADDGIWVFEQSYLPMMLETTSYDTICHEHVSYYAFRQILWMTERVGFNVVDVEFNQTNGGSFAVTVAKKGGRHVANQPRIDAILERERESGLGGEAIYDDFRTRVYDHREHLRGVLASFAGERKTVFGYGASTKGNVMLQFCGITPRSAAIYRGREPGQTRLLHSGDADSHHFGIRGARHESRLFHGSAVAFPG
jgi:NDP-4-keto-2,6-dideoxyhexose 3-C-methyltransferase